MDEEKDGGSVVVVHDDSDVVDLLTGLLHANGFQVEWCRTHGDAEERLATTRVDLVIAPLDRPIGKRVYRWAAEHSRALRRRFVFVVDEFPRGLVRPGARERVARFNDLEAVLYAVAATHRRLRTRSPRATQPPPLPTQPPTPTRTRAPTRPPSPTRALTRPPSASTRVPSISTKRPPIPPPPRAARVAPRLLVVEDDPDQLAAMTELLGTVGFEVVAASGVQAAQLLLESTRVDAVLSDWCMTDGTGAELYHWIHDHRPDFVGSLVFITGGDVAAARAYAGPALVLPKGQDSRELAAALAHAVANSRRRPKSTGPITASRPRVRPLERTSELAKEHVLVAVNGEMDTERQPRIRAPEPQ